MASQKEHEEAPEQSDNTVSPVSAGLIDALKGKYQRTKEDIVTYPYVWASCGLVYGSLGCWFAWRFRKLRQLEDRVRALQERIRQRAKQGEEAAFRNSANAAAGHTPSGPLTDSVKPTENTSSAGYSTNSTKSAENIPSATSTN